MLNSPQRIATGDSRILVVTDDDGSNARYVDALSDGRSNFELASDFDDAIRRLRELPTSVCVVAAADRGDGVSLKHLVAEGRRNTAATHFVVLTESDQPADSPAVLDSRIDTYRLPMPETHLRSAVRAAYLRSRVQQELDGHKNRMKRWISRELVGQSPAMERFRQQLAEAAAHSGHLVIRGEAGAGLTAGAQAVHAIDPRTNAGIIHVDCRITSAEIFQRDLLGEAGGNTVVFATQCGISAAGTIVLDHADSASLSLQDRVVSLLKKSRSDIRLVVCTNSDLRELMQQGRFRDDLIHRLGHDAIEVPSLRERRPDIGMLTEHFLARVAMRNGVPPKRLSVDGLEVLEEHDWPGNLAELGRLIDHVDTVERGDELTAAKLRPWIQTTAEFQGDAGDGMSLREMERKLIESAFVRFRGNREQTAKQLQIGLRTLSGKLRDYGYPPRGGPGSNVRTEQRKAA